MWVLDHLDDLESDFSVFHRVDDITALDGPRFFRLAYRIAAYSGVMAARIAEQEHRTTGPAGRSGTAAQQRPVDVEPELVQLQLDGIVERATSR